jgi:parafibromin
LGVNVRFWKNLENVEADWRLLTATTTMAETDALNVLRHAIETKRTIKFLTSEQQPTTSLAQAAFLVIPQSSSTPPVTLSKSTPTRLRKPNHTSTDPSTDPSDFFALDAVFLSWSLKDAATAEYMKNARESGIGIPNMVPITEKQGVAEWLEGKTDSHPNVVPLQGA